MSNKELYNTYHNKMIGNQKLAGFLLMEGFNLICKRPDKKNPQKYVFFFVNSDKLKEKIDEYYRLRGKEKVM